ncbi:MAG: hypothetical protein RLZZ45_760, partial [Bacteroidota bacterium]
MLRNVFLILVLFLICSSTNAQELNAKVNVVYAQIGTTVDKKVFQTLQTSLVNFLNKRKWASDVFESNERVDCS